MLRIVQQLGYLMCGQESLIESVLGQDSKGVRQSRYIVVTDKVFEMADMAQHDHCPFVLAVVLFHMVLRGLFLRVLYHRAAITLQKRYRYLKQKEHKASQVGPAVTIQRVWRGLRTALAIVKMDDAAYKIQQSWVACVRLRRNRQLVESTGKIHKIWTGAIYRMWMTDMHLAAVFVQKIVRGHLVRTLLDKNGRKLYRQMRGQIMELQARKSSMTEAVYIARMAALAGRIRKELHDHRKVVMESRKLAAFSVQGMRGNLFRARDKEKKIAQTGVVQPVRLSVFEPIVIAKRRIVIPEAADKKRIAGSATGSRVHVQILAQKKKLDRMLPQKEVVSFESHAASKRGRAAIRARRAAKGVVPAMEQQCTIEPACFARWMACLGDREQRRP